MRTFCSAQWSQIWPFLSWREKDTRPSVQIAHVSEKLDKIKLV